MDRAEHLDWCKQRAIELLDSGDIVGSLTLMLSDMKKHDDTRGAMETMKPLFAFELVHPDTASARRFIEGFN